MLDVRAPAIVRRRRCEGFSGQRIVAVPPDVLATARRHPLLHGLIPTKIGFFPTAEDHRHECKEKIERAGFMYCSKGRGWCELRGRLHEVNAGSLLVSLPGEIYAHGANDRDPWTISWFQVVGDDLGPLLTELGATTDRPVLPLTDSPRWRALFEDALETLEQGHTTAHLIHTAGALGHLLRSTLWGIRQQRAAPGPDERIAQCMEFMRQHLRQPLTLSSLAAMANMSPARFKMHFKRYTGESCIAYFIKLRIAHACQLLETTDLSIKMIADEVGYSDPFWFSKAFHALKHLAPSDYRRQRRS